MKSLSAICVCLLIAAVGLPQAGGHCPGHTNPGLPAGQSGQGPTPGKPGQSPTDPAGGGGGDPGGKPKSDPGNDGEPVYLKSGEFVYSATDMTLRCRGIDIVIERTYRSQSSFNGQFGYGWCMSYYWRIKRETNGNAMLVDGTGFRREFAFDSTTGSFSKAAGSFDTLANDGTGGFILTRGYGIRFFFDANGCLSQIATRHGNTLTFVYASGPGGKAVTCEIKGVSPYFVREQTKGLIAMDYRLVAIQDPVGRRVAFAYDADGRVTTITDWGGRTVTYTYDDQNNLTAAAKPGLASTKYGYDPANKHNLTSITDPSGQKYLETVYNDSDKVTSQKYGQGTFTFEYDSPTQVTVTNRRGFKTVSTLDAKGYVTSEKRYNADMSVCLETKYAYDGNGMRTSVTFPRGNSTLYSYDGRGNLTSVRRRPIGGNADGRDDIVSSFSYDPAYPTLDLVKEQTDAAGWTTAYTRTGPAGEATAINRPSLGAFAYTYDQFGQTLTQTDPHGTLTKYEYDGNGYPTKAIRDFGGLNATTAFEVDSWGNVTKITDPLSHETSLTYNERDQIVSVDPPEVPLTTYTYNANGLLAQVSRPEGDTTAYVYDELDNVKETTTDLGTTKLERDTNENITKVTDGNGKSTNYAYDAFDRRTSETNALGYTTGYAYDDNGNLSRLTDANNNATDYQYNGFDQRAKTTYPSPDGAGPRPVEEFGYDGLDRITSLKTRAGVTLPFAYDGAGRTTRNGRVDGTYAYDGLRMVSATHPTDGTITFSDHDALHRVGTITYPGGFAFHYEYDLAGNRTKMTYPEGDFIAYEPDALGRIDKIKNATGQAIADNTYDGLSRPSRLDYLNGTNVSWAYLSPRKLGSVQSHKGADLICGYSYTYDTVGNRTSMTSLHRNSQVDTYEYDDIYQLTKATYGDGTFEDFGKTTPYDKLGNRVQTANGGTSSYVTNKLNQYTSVGGNAFTYDANGNLTSDGTRTFTYNAMNQLVGATANGHTTSCTYDAFGRRASKTVDGVKTRFLYDGLHCVVELDGVGNIIGKYVQGELIDEVLTAVRGGQTYYYHADALGSIGGLTDSTGDAVELYSYTAFGMPTIYGSNRAEIPKTSIGNDTLFTGRRWDVETAVYSYRIRMYDPRAGMFLQADPTGYTDGMNAYTYVGDNPIRYSDPLGLCKDDSDRPLWEEAWDRWSDLVTSDDPNSWWNEFWKLNYEQMRDGDPRWQALDVLAWGSVSMVDKLSDPDASSAEKWKAVGKTALDLGGGTALKMLNKALAAERIRNAGGSLTKMQKAVDTYKRQRDLLSTLDKVGKVKKLNDLGQLRK